MVRALPYMPRIGIKSKKCVRRPPLKLKVNQIIAIQKPPKKFASVRAKIKEEYFFMRHLVYTYQSIYPSIQVHCFAVTLLPGGVWGLSIYLSIIYL